MAHFMFTITSRLLREGERSCVLVWRRDSKLVMVAKNIQQRVKKVYQGLEIVGLIEALVHFEQTCTCWVLAR